MDASRVRAKRRDFDPERRLHDIVSRRWLDVRERRMGTSRRGARWLRQQLHHDISGSGMGVLERRLAAARFGTGRRRHRTLE
jgi:hypothetical protein